MNDDLDQIFKDLSRNEVNDKFVHACGKGNLEYVKYLLTSPNLKHKANINFNSDWGLSRACMSGHLHIVEYLLTSPELKKHANFRSDDYHSLKCACYSGHLDIVKFFFTSTYFKEKINIHYDKDSFFNMALDGNNIDIIQYFIFDLNISKTKEISFELSKKNSEIYEKVKNMFKLRDLNEELHQELPCSEEKIRKPKI